MQWLLPAAWVGAIAVVVPILVHLLSRDAATRYKFPSLRFLDLVSVEPARRTRLTDPLLLLVRCVIILVAVAALARPWWPSADDAARIAAWTARAIVVDTSASMRQRRVGATSALDEARARARALADSSAVSVVIETAHPSTALRGSVQWLAQRGGRGEIVIVTDLQRGVLHPTDLDAVPTEVGVRIVPIEGVLEPESARSGPGVPLVSDVRTRAQLAQAVRIAREFVDEPRVPPVPLRVRVVDSMLPSDTGTVLTRAQAEQVRRFEIDPLSPFTRRTVRTVGDTLEFLVFGSEYAVAEATVMAWRSAQDPLAMFERDTTVIPAATAQQWERPGAERAVAPELARDVTSDARWWWGAVLVLLAVEAVLRRRRPVSA